MDVGGWGGGLLSALRAIVSPQTWLAVIHLIAGFLIGLVSFTLALTGVLLGVSLLPLLLSGIAVLIATFWVCGLIARAERARYALLLGTAIPAPPPRKRPTGWRWLNLAYVAGSRWRDFWYALLRFPLSLVEVTVVALVWALGLVLLTLPAYNAALPEGGAHVHGVVLRGPLWLAVAAAAGLALLLAAPWLTRLLADGDAAVGMALLGTGRQADLTARIGELETSRARVVDSAEAERRRIERDLHDGAQQRLVSLAMELGRARAKFANDPEEAQVIVGQAHEQAKQALTELRNLVRGVHPPVLSDRGLDAALSGLAALSPVPVAVRVDAGPRPPASVEAIAYFVAAEALTNVAKHARATHAEVAVTRQGDLLTVVIDDDGAGGADPAGQGLSGLADRLAGVDGTLTVTSPQGGPTRIEARIPCGS